MLVPPSNVSHNGTNWKHRHTHTQIAFYILISSPFLSSEYKLRYRSSEEGSKAEEMYIKEFRSEDSEINAILKVNYLKIIF